MRVKIRHMVDTEINPGALNDVITCIANGEIDISNIKPRLDCLVEGNQNEYICSPNPS